MRLAIGLPLTAKELIELSVRRRTYLLRLLAGIGLGLVAGLVLYQQQRYDNDLTGKGMEVFSALSLLITWLPVVLAPAMVAATIAGEREDGSLPLLQMTRLSPTVIILEKWLSRLIALASLQILALPLLALAYAVGGVREETIWWTILGALAATAHASALAILASAWCRGTVGALFTGYALILVSYGVGWWAAGSTTSSFAVGGWAAGSTTSSFVAAQAPAVAVFWATADRFSSIGVGTAHEAILLSAVPTLVALLLARIVLTRRGQAAGGNRLLALFRRLDAWFEAVELRSFGRTIRRELPHDRPVAWRECNRRTLVNPRYLTRILLPVGGVVLLVMGYGVSMHSRSGVAVTAWIGGIVEVGLTLMVLILGATVFTAERSAQTLEVLLTTPMSPREILAQKLSGLRRVHLGGAILVGLIIFLRWAFALDTLFEYTGWSPVLGLLSIALLPETMAWLGLVIGLHVRSRARAVGTAVAVLVGWTVVGILIAAGAEVVLELRGEVPLLASVLIPSCLGVMNHAATFRAEHTFICGISFAVAQVMVMLALRLYAYRRVGPLLRRS